MRVTHFGEEPPAGAAYLFGAQHSFGRKQARLLLLGGAVECVGLNMP